jgi:hypothetical protein
LAISGTPASVAAAGQRYAFQPTVTATDGSTYSFTITNKPSWLTLNIETGSLTGTPGTSDVGTYSDIQLSVTTATDSATLPKFAIAVQAVTATSTVKIAGTPPGSVTVGGEYMFTPAASTSSGGSLAFSVQNLPAWATFDSSTGTLSGAPGATDVGTYTGIVISATDGMGSAALGTFSIAVNAAGSGIGSATLSWVVPTTNTDGSALTDLTGFRIYYGNSSNSLTQTITISSTGLTIYVVTNLPSGTWYFAVKAYNSANVESNLSAIVSKKI